MPKIGVGSRGTWNMPRRDQPSVGAHLRLVPELHFGARARGCHAFTGPAGPGTSGPNSMLTKRLAPLRVCQAPVCSRPLRAPTKLTRRKSAFRSRPPTPCPPFGPKGKKTGPHPLLHSRLDHARASICRAAEVREGSCRLLADGDATHPCKAPVGPFRQMSCAPLVGQRAGEHAMRPVEEGVSGRPRN
jgi:hypothetical protein